MSNPKFDNRDRYVLEDYQRRPPLSSFLPGIAGKTGIPLWAFYVNRAQGIASFGVESKDCAIVEYEPANKAYRNVSVTGLDLGFVVNHTTGGVSKGVQIGIVGLNEADFVGFQNNFINIVGGDFEGFQWGFVNHSYHANGFQLGIVNYAECMRGLQIGLINIIRQGGQFPVFPFVNWSF